MSTSIYDAAYHNKFLERANTELGKKIYQARWDLVMRHAHGNLTLLDFGCASGAFHTSSPNGYRTEGYDVNPHTGFSSTERMGFREFDIMTMWDSIEHVHDPVGLIESLEPTWIFLSTPNLESVRGDIRQWRHYRPAEHLYYFDRHSLTEILGHCGYDVKEVNFEEGALRDPQNPEAIITMAAKRRS